MIIVHIENESKKKHNFVALKVCLSIACTLDFVPFIIDVNCKFVMAITLCKV